MGRVRDDPGPKYRMGGLEPGRQSLHARRAIAAAGGSANLFGTPAAALLDSRSFPWCRETAYPVQQRRGTVRAMVARNESCPAVCCSIWFGV